MLPQHSIFPGSCSHQNVFFWCQFSATFKCRYPSASVNTRWGRAFSLDIAGKPWPAVDGTLLASVVSCLEVRLGEIS